MMKVFFLFSLMAIFSSCEQSVLEQFSKQDVVYTLEEEDQVIQINGQSNDYNINIYLEIKHYDLNANKFRIVFSQFTSIHLTQLIIENNILDYDEQSTKIPLLLFHECGSVTIDYFKVIQTEEYTYGHDIVILYRTALLVSKGEINYIQTYKQISDITKILTINNIDTEDISIILMNFTFLISIPSELTDPKTMIDIIGGKSALIQDFKINIQVYDSINSLPQINYTILQLKGLKEQIKLINFQFSSYSTSLIYASKLITPLISLDSCTSINFDNINVQLYQIYFQIAQITNSQSADLTNIYLHDTTLTNDTYDDLKLFFIGTIDIVNILNVFIRDIPEIVLITLFYFQKINYLYLTNLNFSKNENIINQQFIDCQLLQNQSNVTWNDGIIAVEQVNNTVLDSLNICGLVSTGNVRGLIQFLRWTLPYSLNATLKNINQYINSKEYNARLYFSTKVSMLNLTIQNYSLIINAEINELQFTYAGFIYIIINSEGIFNLLVDQFFIDIINTQKNDLVIITKKGTIFSIFTPTKGSYTTKFSNMMIKNLNSTGISGFAYVEAPNFILENSYFYNIQTQTSGGVLYLTSININIKNVTFDSCSAQYFGGAITSIKDKQFKYWLYTEQLVIKNCKALIGAGVYGPDEFLVQKIKYEGNKALVYGNNYSQYITKLEVPRIIQYNPDMEGIFREINQTGSSYNLYQQRNQNWYVFLLELNQVYLKFLYYFQLKFFIGDKEVIVDENNIDPSQLNLSRYFSFFSTVYLDVNNYLNISQFHFQLLFEDLPEYPNQIIQIIQFGNIQLPIMIQQNQTCTNGQILQNNGLCVYCDTFSCTDRANSNQQEQCISCNASIHDTCYGYLSFLKQGYIRYSYSPFENQTYQCTYAPENCIGGSEKNDQLCESTHLGPECSECDFRNIRGYGQYARTQTLQCIGCNSYSINYFLFILQFFIGFVITWMLYQNISYLKDQICNNNILVTTNHTMLRRDFNPQTDHQQNLFEEQEKTEGNINTQNDVSSNQIISSKKSGLFIDERLLQINYEKSEKVYSDLDSQNKEGKDVEIYTNQNEDKPELEGDFRYDMLKIKKQSFQNQCFNLDIDLNQIETQTITSRKEKVIDSCDVSFRVSLEQQNQKSQRISDKQQQEEMIQSEKSLNETEIAHKRNHSVYYLKMLIFYLNIIYFSSFYKFTNINQQVLDSLFLFQINIYNPVIGSYFSYFKCFFIQILPLEFESPQHLTIIILGCLPIALILIFLTAKLLFHPLASFFKVVYFKLKRRRQIQDQLNQNLNVVNQQDKQKQQFQLFKGTNFLFFKQFLIFSLYLVSFQQIESILQGIVCINFGGYGEVTMANLVLSCDNSQFLVMRIFLIFLLIFYFSLLIGLFSIRILLQKRDIILGFNKSDFYFMHTEYKEKYYYWEVIRSALRILMIAVIFIFPLQNQIIGFFILILIGFYSIFLIRNNPYQKKKYFNLELYLIGSGFFTLFNYIMSSSLVQYSNESPIFIQDMVYFGNYQSGVTVFFLALKYIQYYFKFIFQNKNKQTINN